jgi:hypothetical protein
VSVRRQRIATILAFAGLLIMPIGAATRLAKFAVGDCRPYRYRTITSVH